MRRVVLKWDKSRCLRREWEEFDAVEQEAVVRAGEEQAEGDGPVVGLAGGGPGGHAHALLVLQEVFNRDEEGWGDEARRGVTGTREGACEIGDIGRDVSGSGDLGGVGLGGDRGEPEGEEEAATSYTG